MTATRAIITRPAEPERSDTPLSPLLHSNTPTGRAYARAVADVKNLLEHERAIIQGHGRGDALATLSATAFDLSPGAFAAQGKGTQRVLTQQLEAHRAVALDAVITATRLPSMYSTVSVRPSA